MGSLPRDGVILGWGAPGGSGPRNGVGLGGHLAVAPQGMGWDSRVFWPLRFGTAALPCLSPGNRAWPVRTAAAPPYPGAAAESFPVPESTSAICDLPLQVLRRAARVLRVAEWPEETMRKFSSTMNYTEQSVQVGSVCECKQVCVMCPLTSVFV